MAHRITARERTRSKISTKKDPRTGAIHRNKNAKRDDEPLAMQKIVAPPKLTVEEAGPLSDEQQVVRVEILMIKGLRDKNTIQTLLGIEDPRQVDRYMNRVKARWEILGGNTDLRKARGESIKRLDLVENELWVRVSNVKDTRAEIVALKTILETNKYRNEMMGLSAEMAVKLATTTKENIVLTRMAKQNKLREVAMRMLEALRNDAGNEDIVVGDDGKVEDAE